MNNYKTLNCIFSYPYTKLKNIKVCLQGYYIVILHSDLHYCIWQKYFETKISKLKYNSAFLPKCTSIYQFNMQHVELLRKHGKNQVCIFKCLALSNKGNSHSLGQWCFEPPLETLPTQVARFLVQAAWPHAGEIVLIRQPMTRFNTSTLEAMWAVLVYNFMEASLFVVKNESKEVVWPRTGQIGTVFPLFL